MQIRVEAMSTIAVVRKLVVEQQRTPVMVLCFGDSKEQAPEYDCGCSGQEQIICYSSNMHSQTVARACQKMYEHNGGALPKAQNFMAVVENAVVFRDENFQLLEKPFLASFLVACAPRASDPESRAIMEERIKRVIDVAASEKFNPQSLVLGAFGCGNRGHAPADVANVFKRILIDNGKCLCFDQIVFAIFPSKGPEFEIFKSVFP
jgi:uncharacterized protein (TIGR02452 family)